MLFGMEISWTRSLGVTAAVISCAYKTVMYVHVRIRVVVRFIELEDACMSGSYDTVEGFSFL